MKLCRLKKKLIKQNGEFKAEILEFVCPKEIFL